MLKCQEVEKKIGSGGIGNAGLMERLALRLHLMMCRHCRTYARQIRAIGDAVRDVFTLSSTDSENLARLRERISDR